MVRYIAILLLGAGAGAGGFFAYTGWSAGEERTLGDEDAISICSFNVQFVGQSDHRENDALAELMRPYDIVVVQEVLAHPVHGTYPDGSERKHDEEVADFFDAMAAVGFEFVMSEEDTGRTTNHNRGTASEWFVAFFKPDRVTPATDIPHGFIGAPLTGHPDFDRVPYAFGFRTPDNNLDFVLVSVHLHPDPGSADKDRREEEMDGITAWISTNNAQEQDIIVLGDFNFHTKDELIARTPPGYFSINFWPVNTNTNPNGKPYDHVFLNPYPTSEWDPTFGFVVVDLVASMQEPWEDAHPGETYPGDPYDHDDFRSAFSDHHPVVFKLRIPEQDDD